MRTFLLLSVFLTSAFYLRGQVNLQTGSATTDISIFEWKDNISALNTLIDLNYNSKNGLKVDEVASNVGQGWNLIAGGFIVRQQVGEPDDQKPKDGFFHDLTKYPPGYLYNEKSPKDGCPGALIQYPIFSSENMPYVNHNSVAADRELDKFSFQFNGRSGEFVLSKSNDIGITIGDSRLKIWFTRDENLPARTKINGFYIQDENGLIYKFKEIDFLGVMMDANQTSISEKVDFATTIPTGDRVGSTWKLSEISDPETGRSIFFHYATRNLYNPAGYTISLNCTQKEQYPPIGATMEEYYENKKIIISENKVFLVKNDLVDIDFPDGHKIEFGYGLERKDVAGDYILQSILVKKNFLNIEKFVFKHGYSYNGGHITPVEEFVRLSSTEINQSNSRLFLMSLQKYGNDLTNAEPPYLFKYYEGTEGDDIIPLPNTYFKDIWGYYNGTLPSIPTIVPLTSLRFDQLCLLTFVPVNNGSAMISSPRIINPKEGYAKNGLLKSVRYPLGSTLTYYYQQNKGILSNDQVSDGMVGGVSVSKTSMDPGPSGISMTQIINGASVQVEDRPISVTTYDYLGKDGKSSRWGIEKPDKYTKSLETSYKREGLGPFCSFTYKYPGLYRGARVSSNPTHGNLLSTYLAMKNIYGQINSYSDLITSVNNVVTISGMHYWDPVASELAQNILQQSSENIITFVIQFFLSAFTCEEHIETRKSFVYSNINTRDINPLPAQFRRVVVTTNDPSVSGKIIYEFTSNNDYPLWIPENFSNISGQRYAPWLYGLTKNITYLDGNNKKVKEEFFVYSAPVIRDMDDGYSCNCEVIFNVSQKDPDWNDPNLYNSPSSYKTASTAAMNVNIYRYKTGRTEVKDKIVRVYKRDDSGIFMDNVVSYVFNSKNYQVSSVKTEESDGSASTVETYYPEDFSNGDQALQKLITNNRINTQISKYVSKTSDYSSAPIYLDASVTLFSILPSGQVRPTEVFASKSAVVDHFIFDPQASLTAYPGLYKKQTIKYNSNGNVEASIDQGGRVTSNIYGYEDKYIIAKVVNSDISMDAPAYTSFEDKDYGGWRLEGTGFSFIDGGVTGDKCLRLQGTYSPSINAYNLNRNKSYRVTVWANGEVKVKVSGLYIPAVEITEPIGEFHCFEFIVTNHSGEVRVEGDGYLDELRICPTDARMTTSTYNILYGKSYECDSNNNIIQYQYDSFGRLTLIKNGKGEIIKAYDYNYNIQLYNN